ncbi:hypothetical protein L1049_006117 [Liquidambar formosana]|uniref:Uncharacterized protein n=1 Tax=Liquidambar formosana TaxID=63359 RepID=A0AAP0REZ9_LIQFO
MSSDAMVERAVKSLGRGFDLTSDFRLRFCKGRDRLVLLNEDETRDLTPSHPPLSPPSLQGSPRCSSCHMGSMCSFKIHRKIWDPHHRGVERWRAGCGGSQAR